MDINEVKSYYKGIIVYRQELLVSLKKTIFRVGTIRLLVVLTGFIGAYYTWGHAMLVVSSIAVSFIAFLFLMTYHSKLFKARKYNEQQVLNAQNELDGIEYNFSAFDGASEKADIEHSFSLDLDLFGNRSFFQSINRTVTSFGKDCLATIFIVPLESKEKILVRQEALKELTANKELVAHFRAVGQTSEIDKLNAKDFATAFGQPALFRISQVWQALVYLFPLLYVSLGLLVYLDVASGTLFLPLYLLSFAISAMPGKGVKHIMSTFDTKSQVLATYSELFEIIENEDLKASYLQEIKTQCGSELKASKAIAQLRSLHNNLLMAEAYPILLFLNPVLLWNVKYAIKIEEWTFKHKTEIEQWFAAMAAFDALLSLAIFAFNHPDYTYPKPADQFVFKGLALGHPMLNRDVCVRNDVDISKIPYFLVITGANMAGKSTYLRTIGINHTLACAGAVVCARELEFYPSKLVTNLRTSDSLADNESYFFAELKRLKMIIDRLKKGEELFIILDEILKGTNSVDKQKGSMALMKQLISLNGNGIIATHDLLLGNLEKDYPANIKNYRFEADITDNTLSFTYAIREGVAQNMNASFLMTQMGITGL